MFKIIHKIQTMVYLAFIRIFSFFPVDSKKILFDNFNGKGYAGNPKYIAEYIIRRNEGYKLIWIVNRDVNPNDFPKNITLIKSRTIRAAYEVETSKYWIDNVRKTGFKKRKEQLYLQVWHGVIGIKKVEGQVSDKLDKKYIDSAKLDSKATDYLIAPCRRYKSIMEKSFWISSKKIHLIGSPEFDILYNNIEKTKKSIKKKLEIGDKKILLYAPTFRENCSFDYFCVDFNNVLSALTKRFGGEWILAIRLHPNVHNPSYNSINSKWIDLTNYCDVQELIIASDAVITDYSSVIFSSAIIHIPSFIHAIDLDQYRTERNFEIKFCELPFPISQTNEQLVENIKKYDNMYTNVAIDRFFSKLGIVFDGKYSERAIDLLFS